MARRNVLLVVVDQWRADCLPMLGTPFLRTPNLDRLCREGVIFRSHVTTTVPCGPARASLLTAAHAATETSHRATASAGCRMRIVRSRGRFGAVIPLAHRHVSTLGQEWVPTKLERRWSVGQGDDTAYPHGFAASESKSGSQALTLSPGSSC